MAKKATASRGRPKDDNPKIEQVLVRFTAEEIEAIERNISFMEKLHGHRISKPEAIRQWIRNVLSVKTPKYKI